MSEAWHIGVLGGSGLYEGIALENQQQIEVSSPFGEPSGPVTTGTVGHVRLTFMARHGVGHAKSPDTVNYRANIDVMKRCGVTDLIAISAIGSLREEMAPPHFVGVDQFIDRTSGRTSGSPRWSPMRLNRADLPSIAAAPTSRWKGRNSRPARKAACIAAGAGT